MKTNNNIVSNESLEYAVYRYYPEEKEDYYTSGERIAFANGWKEKEKQLKPLLESHAELLEALKELLEDYKYSCEANDINVEKDRLYIQSFNVIEKANKLLNSIK